MTDMHAALKPFLTFAEAFIEKTDSGWRWKNGSGAERVCDWFGPSDFGLLQHFAAPGEPVAWQWKHHDPISGNVVWRERQLWNGHRSTEQRALYASPRALDVEQIARNAVAALNCDWGYNKNPTRDEAEKTIAAALAKLGER